MSDTCAWGDYGRERWEAQRRDPTTGLYDPGDDTPSASDLHDDQEDHE